MTISKSFAKRSSLLTMMGFTCLLGLRSPVSAAPPQAVTIPCPPNKITMPPGQSDLFRAKGDASTWEFKIEPAAGVTITEQDWTYPGEGGADPDWGTWAGGDGTNSLSWSSPDKAGSFTVKVKAKRRCAGAGGGGAVDEDFEVEWSGDVIEVESVEWMPINSPLDGNPNASGGQRIFPDRNSPIDMIVRNTVRVRAKISKAKAGIPVYFRLFDVDDPSTNNAPVDANGANGGDNRGTGT
ncbi:MAG: hypothetical protein M3347_10795, partial [Armatimonadota bacterium]|nr:hypothetical protein [Armatimonadota bacterium]